MHAQIRKVGIGLIVAFTAIFVQLNYVQIFAAERIAENNANRRSLLQQYSIKRGDIVTIDGRRIAVSEDTGGKLRYRRTYPGGELYGHITGFASINYGNSRIEQTFDDALLGDSGVVTMQDIEDRLLGGGDAGDDVRLTIHSRLQETARSALGTNRGAVVALDPTTGEVRALWSNPGYDPTPLASHDARESRAYWESLKPNSPRSPLVSLATSGGYPPGSTFKVVTAAAALESGSYTRSSTFPDPDRLEPCSETEEEDEPCMPLTTKSLTNFTNRSCLGGTEITLFDALRVSCDTTFAIIGLDVPGDVRDTAEAFGFNSELPLDVGNQPSTMPDIPDDREPLRAYAGIGQGDVVATPLQMALVAAGIANDGRVARPRLVREILSPKGEIVRRFDTEIMSEAVSADTAQEVTDMMVAAVENGTGTTAQIPGIEVAGKTGTAQTVEGANPHTWFICFAPADDPKLAVAVIVEHGGTFGSEATGAAVAAPIAKTMLETDRSIRGW